MVGAAGRPSTRMKSQVNVWSLFDLIAPCCPACGLAAGRCGSLCAGCTSDLPALRNPCPRCGLPATGNDHAGGDQADSGGGDDNRADSNCAGAHDPAVERTLAACAYAFPLDALVQQLKFGGRLPLARPLGRLLADAVRRDAALRHGASLPAALLPVPLHPARERQRGFNQAEAIARAAAAELGIPLLAGAVRRRRDTPAQSGLDLAARRRNLQGAFTVSGSLPAHIALVDDVITTGSTMAALAAVLRRHGVTRVDAWAVARTL